MQVDYLLYHEDYKKIEGMLEGLTDCSNPSGVDITMHQTAGTDLHGLV
jgi:hypothetical protein